MLRLRERELERAAVRLALPTWLHDGGAVPDVEAQGYGGARVVSPEDPPPVDAAWVLFPPSGPAGHQWLPWLANELLLQPGADVVGADGWYAARSYSGKALRPPQLRAHLEERARHARAVGPPPPRCMSPLVRKSASLRERTVALLNDWRHRKVRLPKEW